MKIIYAIMYCISKIIQLIGYFIYKTIKKVFKTISLIAVIISLPILMVISRTKYEEEMTIKDIKDLLQFVIKE